MAIIPREFLRESLQVLLRPLFRFVVRQGVSFQEFNSIAKDFFVRTAAEELVALGAKVNVSRISACTGIHRDEVTRILRGANSEQERPLGPLARIIGQWEGDATFVSNTGSPRVLSQAEFKQLVTSVSQHLNSGTILFELERSGLVERTKRGIKLVQQVVRHAENPSRGIELLSQDTESLMSAVSENLFARATHPNLHIRTEYDRIIKSAIPQIREWILSEGAAFHKRVREYLSQFDADINPDPKKPFPETGRVVVTAFSATIPPESPLPHSPKRAE